MDDNKLKDDSLSYAASPETSLTPEECINVFARNGKEVKEQRQLKWQYSYHALFRQE